MKIHKTSSEQPTTNATPAFTVVLATDTLNNKPGTYIHNPMSNEFNHGRLYNSMSQAEQAYEQRCAENRVRPLESK